MRQASSLHAYSWWPDASLAATADAVETCKTHFRLTLARLLRNAGQAVTVELEVCIRKASSITRRLKTYPFGRMINELPDLTPNCVIVRSIRPGGMFAKPSLVMQNGHKNMKVCAALVVLVHGQWLNFQSAAKQASLCSGSVPVCGNSKPVSAAPHCYMAACTKHCLSQIDLPGSPTAFDKQSIHFHKVSSLSQLCSKRSVLAKYQNT